jgi:hypothetical protein
VYSKRNFAVERCLQPFRRFRRFRRSARRESYSRAGKTVGKTKKSILFFNFLQTKRTTQQNNKTTKLMEHIIYNNFPSSLDVNGTENLELNIRRKVTQGKIYLIEEPLLNFALLLYIYFCNS